MSESFWSLYITIFSLAFITSVVYWVIRRYSPLAAIALILSPLLPLVAFVYTVQRTSGNEYEYLREQLQSNDWLAISLTVGYVYIASWLLFVLVDVCIKIGKIPYVNEKLKWFWNKCHYYVDLVFHWIRDKWPGMKKTEKETYEEPKRESQ